MCQSTIGGRKIGAYRRSWSRLQTTFLSQLTEAGFPRESIDTVLCTHPHADHIGWNTMRVDNKWVPTFPNARYLLGRVEYRATQARDQIVVATSADSWKIVQRAEELGFSHAWFYDTQMLCADCFVAMGAAAMKTSRIRLGTGVPAPSNRIAPVTANAFATLNKLAPGRIDFGVGTGFTARRAMGMDAIKLAEMEEYIRIVTADLIRTSTFTATQKELIERIGVMRDAGYTQFAIQITQGQEDSIQDWAKVMDAFRKI